MQIEFTTTIGDDIEVEVAGDYDKPDRSVGYSGSFQVNTVTLPGSGVDLSSLLDKKTEERLEEKGMQIGYERSREIA